MFYLVVALSFFVNAYWCAEHAFHLSENKRIRSFHQNDLSKYNNRSFPAYFKFGVAMAAFQSEGAWDADGKGPSIWDHGLHTKANITSDGSNADIALDFYHKYVDDIALLKDLGVDFLRISISWPRILPNGTKDRINRKGLDFYRSLITELLKNGMEPMVTMYHFDLPQVLHERGGFLNESFTEWFADYARIVFRELGDLVKIWTTFNEPTIMCPAGYGKGLMAPFINGDGVLDYQCGHNLLKAHAKAYHIYDEEFRASQKGEIGIIFMSDWFEPGSNSTEDKEAALTAMQFMMGWFANPIFVGDYPEIMKIKIEKRSCLEGRTKSRLPEFTSEEIDYIKGTYDYFAFNYYNAYLTYALPEVPVKIGTNYDYDVGVRLQVSPEWAETCFDRIHVAPFGLRRSLVFIKEMYGNLPIYITENGLCDFGGLNDTHRIDYIKSHLSEVLYAIQEDNVDVRKYAHWNAFDDFEWIFGYMPKYGLYHVDFNKTDLPRTPKMSANAYKKIIKTKCLVENCQ